MRRLLTFLTAIVLLIGSLAVGVVTADLPFWRRAFDLPLTPGESYVPTIRIGAAAVGDSPADVRPSTLDATRLDAAAERARAGGADALLVAHRGTLEFERYFRPGGGGRALLPADFLARPLAAIAVGFAHADGRIGSLDDTLAKYLPEWDDDPRGAITLRQILDETSGLETGVDAARVLGSRPFAAPARLPKFATSRGVRLVLGNDFESTALGFRLVHEPGGFFNVSPVNAQLAAVLVQRATGIGYADYLAQKLLLPGGFATFELQLDRESGMPAAHCCVRMSARDALKIVELLRGAGPANLLPAGWAAAMRKGSRANPDFGLQIERLADREPAVYRVGGAQGGSAWIVPEEELSVVVLAPRDAAILPDVLDDVLGALRK